jgi:membrane-bound lytic murein transglycosylase A
VAVDPRTTPLGSPVYLATSQPGGRAPVNRLMVAQDTGGAIRGAVRADFFCGFGADAHAQAAHMKESGRMWLLLPADQQVAARDQALLTRGAGGPAQMTDCVVADPESCVEDR